MLSDILAAVLLIAQLFGLFGMAIYGCAILYYTGAARNGEDGAEKLRRVRERFGGAVTVLAGIAFTAYAIQFGYGLIAGQ